MQWQNFPGQTEELECKIISIFGFLGLEATINHKTNRY